VGESARPRRWSPEFAATKVPSEQAIEPERISDAEDIGGRVVVEADRDVKIDLLGIGHAVAASGIEEVTWATMHVIVTDVFDEQEGALADLPLDNERRFGRELVDRVSGRDEVRHHATQSPAPA
jgi:hypothetical protein